jgi:hypothetical protein
MISSDHSQNGMAAQQVLEDLFDLTQPDFDPVLSVTVAGSEYRSASVSAALRTQHSCPARPAELRELRSF